MLFDNNHVCVSSVFIDLGKNLLGQCEIISQAKWNQMRLLLIRLFKPRQQNSQGHSSVAFQRGLLFYSGCLSRVPKEQEQAEFEEAASQLGGFLPSQAWRNSRADASSWNRWSVCLSYH